MAYVAPQCSRTRATVGSIITVIGVSVAVMVTKDLILHFVYPDSLIFTDLLKAVGFAFSVLAIGLLILGTSAVPGSLWVYYFVFFLGLGLAAAPLEGRSSTEWNGVDTGVCLAGVVLFGGALSWGYARAKTIRLGR